jgi:5'-3' exoribonuclease 2
VCDPVCDPPFEQHKAVAYIRAQRHAPSYDVTTSHLIHGLDADLMMLALATHEPRFAILRDGQRNKHKRRGPGADGGSRDGADAHSAAPAPPPTVRPSSFDLVRIDTLREYLERELRDADWSGVRTGFELERAIDDFIFLCFFVGNDVMPRAAIRLAPCHIPCHTPCQAPCHATAAAYHARRAVHVAACR